MTQTEPPDPQTGLNASVDAPHVDARILDGSEQPLLSRALRGSGWVVMGYAGSQVLRLGGNLVLTRLLFPEAFGIMAVVHVFLQGMHLFSDLGIGPSIIQNQRGDQQAFLNTAWTMQVIRGVVIWLGMLLLSWPIARFYDQSILQWLIPVVGFTAVVSGFQSTAQFTLNRHLALGKLTVLELGSQLLGIVVMIVWAAMIPTIWALAGAAIVSRLAHTAGSYCLIPGQRNWFAWDREAARAIIHFGKWFFIISILGFLASQVDRLILPKLIPMGLFGIYGIAFMLGMVLDRVVCNLSYKIVFPVVAKQKNLPRDELRTRILRMRGPMLCILALLVSTLSVFGDLLVYFLYDDRYAEAGWMLCILALGLWPRMLTATIEATLLAVGQPRYLAYSGALRFTFLLVGLPIAHSNFGVVGVVVAVGLSGTIDFFVESVGLWRSGLQAVRQDFLTTTLWIALVMILMFIRIQLGYGISFVPES